MMDHFKRLLVLVICVGLLCFSGCTGGNSDLGSVTGTVTVDGKPIENATVAFKPASGRSSVGLTDANGVYTLGYVRNQKGALIGQHKVTIKSKTYDERDYDEAEGSNATKARKEFLPKKYSDRNKTELTANVESGSNTFDFDLKTK